MAATKATRLDPAFAAAVAKVQPALAVWRKQRKCREPIPETLWHDIVRMARAYQLSPVAQALRVNYTALKRRALGNPLATPGRTTGYVRL
jgi:hypothetical protein